MAVSKVLICEAEFSGTLVGFDDYVSKLHLVASQIDIQNIDAIRHGAGGCHRIVRGPNIANWYQCTDPSSDYTGNHTKLSKILLNGNNICMVRTI